MGFNNLFYGAKFHQNVIFGGLQPLQRLFCKSMSLILQIIFSVLHVL
jgi:hypothetical protein